MTSLHASAGPAPGQGLDEVRAPLDRARHAPGYYYGSPEIFRLEKERVFLKDWLYVAREEEVENPGDYLAFRIMGEPVLVVRDQEGALNAFANVCLHRGVEVAHGQGTAKQFSCPYHGWRYGLDGRLAGASFMEHAEGFDPENCRLAPLRIGVWARNVFISFDPEVLPLADFVAPWEHDFGFLRQEDCRLGNKVVVELDCNWKFASENLMDFYHVGVLHVNTFGAKFAVTDDDVTTKEKGGLSIFYKAAAPVPGGQSLFGKMPWLSDQLDSFACTGYLAPNLHIFGRIDCVRPIVIWPLSPDSCRMVCYHLFPKELLARADFAEKSKVYHDYQVEVLEEDRSMIHSMQHATGASTFRPGALSTLERPIHNAVNYHLERLFAES